VRKNSALLRRTIRPEGWPASLISHPPGDTAAHSGSDRVEEEAEHRHEGQAREQLEQQRGHHPARAHVAEAIEDVVQRGHGQQQRPHQHREQGRGGKAPRRENPHVELRKGALGALRVHGARSVLSAAGSATFVLHPASE
jgi:hypothetical protein